MKVVLRLVNSLSGPLGDKRAVLLVQLAPAHARDDARLAYFLQALPEWVRVAVEFRHPSWQHEDIFALLRTYGAAYCVMSGAHLRCVPRTTAGFVYVRMHGPDEIIYTAAPTLTAT
jgi:uncharacterized protein YecE (DUF72 family)